MTNGKISISQVSRSIVRLGGVKNNHIPIDIASAWVKNPWLCPQTYRDQFLFFFNTFRDYRELGVVLCLNWKENTASLRWLEVEEITRASDMEALFSKGEPYRPLW